VFLTEFTSPYSSKTSSSQRDLGLPIGLQKFKGPNFPKKSLGFWSNTSRQPVNSYRDLWKSVYLSLLGLLHPQFYQVTLYIFRIWCLSDRASLWWLKNKNPTTCHYFIALIIGSTCFGHYYAHHQELATVMLITTLLVSFLVCYMLEVRCA